ncbi:MAG: flippase [bacterium]|nr:flippase [bacterium]
MTQGIARRVARNTAWFTIGSVLQKMISFGYFTVVAMAFGNAGTGEYFFALAFTALFAVAADWGIAPVLTREIAKDPTGGRAMIVPAFLLKCCFAVLTAGAVTLLARLLGYDGAARGMIALATLVMVLDSIHLGLYALLRGIQRVHYEAIGFVIGQLALTASGIGILVAVAGLRYDPSVTPVLTTSRTIALAWLLVPYLAASVTNLCIAIVGSAYERVLHVERRRTLAATWRPLVRMATPFAIAGGLARLYTYVDTFLMRTILGAGAIGAIGAYSVAFKITFAFQFIPLAFMGALYPAMSAVALRDRAQLPAIFTSALRTLWIIALPIAVSIGMLAHRIVPMLYGAAFRESIAPLVVLVAALPFIFANFPAGNLLNAIGKPILNTKLLGLATLINVIANVLLIPRFGALGAAYSALIASVTLFIANLMVVRRHARYRVRALAEPFARTSAACLVMAAGLWMWPLLPLAATIPAGAALYVGALFALGGIRRADIRLLRGYFRAPRDATPAATGASR